MADEEAVRELFDAAFLGDTFKLFSLIDADRSLIWEDTSGLTALHLAAWAGKKDALILLLDKGAEINATGEHGTALFAACLGGHMGIVEELLAWGADPNVAATNGETPLMAAAAKGLVDLARRLLAAGADSGARTHSESGILTDDPLPSADVREVAIAAGHPEFLSLIEASNPSPLRQDSGQA